MTCNLSNGPDSVSAINKHYKLAVLLIAVGLLAAFFAPFLTSAAAAPEASWTTLASMPTARGDFGIAVHEGKIYVIGGVNQNGEYLGTVEVYNPATNDWTSKPSMPTQRSEFATAVYNGKIYVFGGNTSSGIIGTTEVFDPQTNAWSTAASMPTPRAGLEAIVVNDQIFLIGGKKYSSISPFYVETAVNECFDPATGAWSTKTSLPTAVFNHAVVVVNNKVYVLGGARLSEAPNTLNIMDSTQVYDVETDRWSLLQALPQATVSGAAGVTAGVFSPQTIYYVGGLGLDEYTGKTYAFMFSNNSWVRVEDMPTARARLGVAVVDDMLYVIGGYDGSSWLNTVERYKPIGYGTVAPIILITSPQNMTYQQVLLTYTINKPVNWVGYSIDAQPNVTISESTRLTGLSQGSHRITLYANDSAGNMGISNTVYFSIDSLAPLLTIINPANRSYDATDIQLQFVVDEANASLSYSLDGQPAVSIIGNMTLVALSNGGHYITVYAVDAMGNVAEETVYFEVAPFPWLLVVGASTVAVIVGAVGYITFRLKRK